MIKAILTKPLDGQPEGAEREFSQADFDRLSAKGAVRASVDVKVTSKPANKKAPPVANKASI